MLHGVGTPSHRSGSGGSYAKVLAVHSINRHFRHMRLEVIAGDTTDTDAQINESATEKFTPLPLHVFSASAKFHPADD
jgi:hypothetical protein